LIAHFLAAAKDVILYLQVFVQHQTPFWIKLFHQGNEELRNVSLRLFPHMSVKTNAVTKIIPSRLDTVLDGCDVIRTLL